MDDGKKGKGGSSIFVLFDSFTLEVKLLSFALFSRTSSPLIRLSINMGLIIVSTFVLIQWSDLELYFDLIFTIPCCIS
jgi:hypothetical protein